MQSIAYWIARHYLVLNISLHNFSNRGHDRDQRSLPD